MGFNVSTCFEANDGLATKVSEDRSLKVLPKTPTEAAADIEAGKHPELDRVDLLCSGSSRAVRLMKKQYDHTRPQRDRARVDTFDAMVAAAAKLQPGAIWINAEPPREDTVHEYLELEAKLSKLGYSTKAQEVNSAALGDYVDCVRWHLVGTAGTKPFEWPTMRTSFPGLHRILEDPRTIGRRYPARAPGPTAAVEREATTFEKHVNRTGPFSARVLRAFVGTDNKVDQDGLRVYSRHHPMPVPARRRRAAAAPLGAPAPARLKSNPTKTRPLLEPLITTSSAA